MPSALPEGQRAPNDGSLPELARGEVSLRPLGIYIHIPFCTTRCGYCDFNTYTAAELNARPRKRLDFQTPAEALQRLLSQPPESVASTA